MENTCVRTITTHLALSLYLHCRLKDEYKSTDEKTNLGFIVSPMCEKQQDPMSVKIVVHSSYTDDPMTFTSDGLSVSAIVVCSSLLNIIFW